MLFRICFGIHGRIISVPYKHFIIFVWLSEDAQRAPLPLINVVFVIVLLYGNDVGAAFGSPLHFTCYFEDGHWPSLHCSFRICFGIHGRIISVPYKHFIIFVWFSEDAQRAPIPLINVVFVIVLLYGNDVGTAFGSPLILSWRLRQPTPFVT